MMTREKKSKLIGLSMLILFVVLFLISGEEKESAIPTYVMATDDDISGDVDGDFRYISNDEYVEIPPRH